MIRTKRLRTTGKSETAQTKKRIQALLRELALGRDGGCVLFELGVHWQHSLSQFRPPQRTATVVSHAAATVRSAPPSAIKKPLNTRKEFGINK